jgi:hypothetical protein
MKVIATVALAFASLHLLCHATHRQEVDITDDKQEETIVDSKNIGDVLTVAAKVVLGNLPQLKKLGITSEHNFKNFKCIQHKEVESGVYNGRVLKYNTEILDVECYTGQITIANPAHHHTDTDFYDPNLFTVDNVGLHLQCITPLVSKYVGKLGGNAFFSMFKSQEAVIWDGPPLCDIRKVEIDNPIVSVETLNLAGDNPKAAGKGEAWKRTYSNVERFVALALHTFVGDKKAEPEKLDLAELEAKAAASEAAEPGNPLISWNSIQRTTCLQNPYRKTSEYSTYEGLCGFVLPQVRLTIDGASLRWTHDHTLAVAKLMVLCKSYSLTKILVYIIKYVHFLSAVKNKFGEAIDHVNPFSENFFGKK